MADAGHGERERRDALRGAEATAPRPTGTGAAATAGGDDDARFRQVDGITDGSASSGVDDANEGRRGESEQTIRSGRISPQLSSEGRGFWDNAEFIPCLDGKVRRTESGVAPLVDWFPGRVEQLRAYGNAIVPQVAEVFIRAYIEVKER
jgi:hypothetical protein